MIEAVFIWSLVFVQLILFEKSNRSRKKMEQSAEQYLDSTRELYESAERTLKPIEIFGNTTFCACESCKNRECPRKLTRLVIADAVHTGVPVRMDNFMDDCSGYTEVDEDVR